MNKVEKSICSLDICSEVHEIVTEDLDLISAGRQWDLGVSADTHGTVTATVTFHFGR